MQNVLNWLAKRAVLPGLEDAVPASLLPVDAVTQASDYDIIRQAEGRAADNYFDVWRGMPVAFEKSDARNVQPPTHWKRYIGRGSMKNGGNRDAACPINALLNFSYAVLEAETLIACRAASLEPSLGLLHADRDRRASFVFDLLEPLRPLVDCYVLELLTKRNFKMNWDFLLLREGVCRVGIELAAEVG
jgi:CRISPR-associated protein Cas1